MYEWVKIAHIVSVICWMVGFLYLPRLMVYHSGAEVGSESSETFKIMERRLLKGIMTPSMIATWIFGIWLVVLLNAWAEAWFISKFFLVLILSAFHGFAAKWVKEFDRDERNRTQKFYRIANEVPAVFMVLIVTLVVLKPFQ